MVGIILSGCSNDSEITAEEMPTKEDSELKIDKLDRLSGPLYGYEDNGRVLVPVDVLQAFYEKEVIFENDKEVVDFVNDEKKVRFTIGDDTADIEGESQEIATEPRMVQGSPYVPIKYVARTFELPYDKKDAPDILKLKARDTEADPLSLHIKPIKSAYKYEPEKIYGLMYHDIAKEADMSNSYTQVTPERFEDQMNALIDAGYETVTDADIVEYRDNPDFNLPKKPILVTFDDGYRSNYEYAFPIMKELGLRGSVYPNVERNDTEQDWFLTWEQMEEMQRSGVINIQTHSYDQHHHIEGKDGEKEAVYITKKPAEDKDKYRERIRADLKLATNRLEEELGHEVHSFAFPFGRYNDTLIDVAKDKGYDLFITTNYNVNTIDDLDDKLFHRMNVPNGYTGEILIEELSKLEPKN